MIGRQNYLVLHKSEWDRLRRKSNPDSTDNKREEYFKALNEQSQKWMKLWPDTVQGRVYQLKKQKTIEHHKHIQTVKEFVLKKKQYDTADAIKRAKEQIFADSCYGRQLLSALLESKTLEERDLQLKFKKELNENISKIAQSNKPKSLSLRDAEQMEVDEIINISRRDQIAKEVAKINIEMFEMKKERRLKEKEEKKLELEDAILNNEFLKKYTEIESKLAYQEKEEIKEYEAENKKIKDFRAKREEQEELKREIWQKYQDRIRNREKAVLYKLHHEKYDSPQCQKIFKTIQNIEENKNNKYDEFIKKGIERWLDRSYKREQKEIENKTSLRNERKLLDEENKIQAELQNRRRLQEIEKCASYRQCILPKGCGAKKHESMIKKDVPTPSFLLPRNKQLEDLKVRQTEPTPWSALKPAHEQFSQHASKTLQECRYKNAARKVVDNYRRVNCLDSKSLPVSNYY
ncbi:trichohyalin-like isoform X1 [Maniola jurtina]|uniref:trichohyalin-like isoform X1 n=1 Tax=Maniola jurtina TaxID=191418 RepID=UPI001E686743|nr:trichohyalin-like isoform X1 [Maniola jurtina]